MTGQPRELIALRDHARAKAAQTELERPQAQSAACRHSGFLDLTHKDCRLGPHACGCTCHDAGRRPLPTEPERALWTQIADEIDAYLTPADHGQGALL